MSLKARWAKVPSRRIEAIGIFVLLVSAGIFAVVTYLNDFGQLGRFAVLTGIVTELANALVSDDPKGYLRALGFPEPFDVIEYIQAGNILKRTSIYHTLWWSSGGTFTLGTLLVVWAKWRG
jgi:hypothetical protein